MIRRAATAVGAALLLASGCGTPRPETAGDLTGLVMPGGIPRPGFSLTRLDGSAFDFGRETAGRLTLLFFGYTNCPDVCPATMANLGAVLTRMTPEDRRRIDLVFVTTDPDRDTPEKLAAWLKYFDPDIIGLTGTIPELEAAQQAARVTVAIRDTTEGNYTVAHAARVLVYSPDDSSHVIYPANTRQAAWGADLPKLLRRWTGSR
ncbi:MAG: SCO family protein [Gemmatimonadales bacterium]